MYARKNHKWFHRVPLLISAACAIPLLGGGAYAEPAPIPVENMPALALPTSSGESQSDQGVVFGEPLQLQELEVDALEPSQGMTVAVHEMTATARQHERPPLEPVPITGSPELAIPDGPPTEANFEGGLEGSVAAAPGDLVSFANTPTVVTVPAQTFAPMEPSVGNNDRIVFQSGNMYAAYSYNDGTTWTYVDPAVAFGPYPPPPPPPPHIAARTRFNGDQIVIYEPSRDIMIWLLQYCKDATCSAASANPGIPCCNAGDCPGGTCDGSAAGSGQQRIAIANGVSDLEKRTWSVSYLFDPQMFGFPPGYWLDFPDMVVGDNFLYVTSNIFSTVNPDPNPLPRTRSVIWRLPLDGLRDHQSPIPFDFVNQLGLPAGERRSSLRATHGTGSTVYFAAHNDTSSLRIFQWSEGSGTIFWDNVSHDAYSQDPMSCPGGPGGGDACGAADTRVLGAYRANGQLGFMWMSAPHGGYPSPYTRVAIFRESDRVLLTNSAIWNPDFAWIYPSVGVNGREHLAGTIFATGGGTNPTPTAVAWINDDFTDPASRDFDPLENKVIRVSTHGPNVNRWGDYVASRPHSRFNNTWIGSAYTLQGGGANGNAEPSHVWFGRERDTPPPRPPNDDCENATVIPSDQYFPPPVNTRGATKSGKDPLQNCTRTGPNRNSNTVWYRYTPACNGTFYISTGASTYDTVLSVYRGTCANLMEIACNDDVGMSPQSQLPNVPVIGGTDYFIEVSKWDDPLGVDVNLEFSFQYTPTCACCDHSQVGGVCTEIVTEALCLVDDQIEYFRGETCANVVARGACREHTGACCDQRIADPVLRCEDEIPESLCAIDDPRQVQWYKYTACADIDCPEHTGACCDEDTFGRCEDNVPASHCNCKKCVFYKDLDCSEVVCLHKAIPTVSEWGLVVMTLLLLTGAKIYFGRRRTEARVS